MDENKKRRKEKEDRNISAEIVQVLSKNKGINTIAQLKRFKVRIDPSTGYMRVYIDGKEYYYHRLAFQIYHKCSLLKGSIVHHKDNNPLNNSKKNLEAMPRKKHTSKAYHRNHLGVNHTEETKIKMSVQYWTRRNSLPQGT